MAMRASRLPVGLAAAAALAACATLPAPTPPQDIRIAGERLFPESITADAAGNIYVGSNPGTVFRARPGSATADPWIIPDARNGVQSVFGVLADDARGLLWLCSNPNTLVQPPQTGAATIKTFALADGALVASYPFPADAGPSSCNDITIDTNGDVYAGDTTGGRIFKLRAAAPAFEPWAAAPELVGMDGISFGPGGALYANNIRRNTLLRIGVADHGSFDNVEVLQTSAPLRGPDGLRPLAGKRMLQSEGNGGTITVLTFPKDSNENGPVQVEIIAQGLDYASSVTAWHGRAYFPEGKLSYLMDPAKRGQDPGAFLIRSVPIAEER